MRAVGIPGFAVGVAWKVVLQLDCDVIELVDPSAFEAILKL